MTRYRVFTVGYAKLTPTQLRKLVRDLKVTLIDCRTYPSGRVKRGFSRADLEKLLGARYEWAGQDLGGKGGGPTTAGLKWLAKDRRRLLLLCQEHAPGECHRHQIALDLAKRGVKVCHIYEEEAIDAVELQRAIDEDDGYEYENLAEVLAELST